MLRAAGGAGAIQILAKSAVAVSCPADTNEDTLATITVPAGAMGPNGVLRITTIWSCTSNVNAKTARIRLGGIGGTAYLSQSLASQLEYGDIRVISNRGAANSQVGWANATNGGPGVNGAAAITSSVDTSASTTIVITGQKATAGDTLTLESYMVELIPGA